MKKNAFTLIELSIALVIIGLIIGGVLVGQDLIYNAKMQSAVSNLQKYSLATNAFKLKYNQLPGDFDGAYSLWAGLTGCGNANVCNGDGDGVIDFVNLPTDLRESLTFRYHLTHAGMLDEKTEQVMPDLEGCTISFRTYAYYDLQATWLHTGEIIGAWGGALCMWPWDAAWIDRKIDDGKGNTGPLVQSRQKTTGGGQLCFDGSGDYYMDPDVIDVTGEKCGLLYKVWD